MKRLALVMLCCIQVAFAATADLDLQSVTLGDFARIVFSQILHRSYLLDTAVLRDDAIVTVDLRNLDTKTIEQETRSILRLHGYDTAETAGVLRVVKAQEAESKPGETLVYRPRARAAAYLIDLASPLFKPGAFATQRRATGIQFSQVNGLPSSVPSPVTQGGQNIGANALTDPDVDVLVFRGSEAEQSRLLAFLAQVDTPVLELLVKAVVFEVSTDSQDQSALSLAAKLLGGKLSLSLGAATAGDYSAVFSGASLQAAYSVLASDSRFKVVSAPTLRVQSGASARLTVGNETPVLGAVSYDQNGRATQSVDYKPSGVILDIKPQIREASADLQISQQISNFITTTTGVNNSPTLIKRELSTSVGIKSDEVLVLGGMDQNQTTDQSVGLPWLPDFLRSHSSQRMRSEILLLLQATRM